MDTMGKNEIKEGQPVPYKNLRLRGEKGYINVYVDIELKKKFEKYCHGVKKQSVSFVIQTFMKKILQKRGML